MQLARRGRPDGRGLRSSGERGAGAASTTPNRSRRSSSSLGRQGRLAATRVPDRSVSSGAGDVGTARPVGAARWAPHVPAAGEHRRGRHGLDSGKKAQGIKRRLLVASSAWSWRPVPGRLTPTTETEPGRCRLGGPGRFLGCWGWVPQRLMIERRFACSGWCRRLSKDYEYVVADRKRGLPGHQHAPAAPDTSPALTGASQAPSHRPAGRRPCRGHHGRNPDQRWPGQRRQGAWATGLVGPGLVGLDDRLDDDPMINTGRGGVRNRMPAGAKEEALRLLGRDCAAVEHGFAHWVSWRAPQGMHARPLRNRPPANSPRPREGRRPEVTGHLPGTIRSRRRAYVTPAFQRPSDLRHHGERVSFQVIGQQGHFSA